MRARIYTNGGNMTGGFTFNGGVMTGALLLAGNPSEALEAAAKQYVDSSLVNLNATNVSTGILPTARLPSFAGDLVKPAGSSTINLAPTGVTAGDFIKPTIDEKGRVVGGGVLTEADVPNMSWNKISVNRPDTLAEYGITNGVSLSGGVLSGFLTFNGTVSQALQAVNKQYVDVTLSNATGISIGDIIRKPYTTTPPGFLKCNGAEVDKTTFNTLYSVIGDRFNKNQQFTSGRPWHNQYTINDTQVGELNSWVASGNLPTALYAGWAFATKNRVYYCCGWTSAYVSTVYTAPINADGTLGAWTTSTAFPFSCGYAQAVVVKKYVYIIGAWTGSGSNTVYYTTLNADGTIGSWGTLNTFPAAASFVHPIVTNNRIYICGGHDGSNVVSTVWTAPINNAGLIGSWSAATSLPIAMNYYSLAVTKNRVYLLGGSPGGNNALNTVYTAIINADGTLGTWSTATPLPTALYYMMCYTTKNRIYLLGGHTGAAQTNTCMSAPINADGTIGTWSVTASLPYNLSHSTIIATKGKLHLIGGHNGSGGIATVLSHTISGGLNDYSSYYAEDKTNYLMPGAGTPWTNQYQMNTAQSVNLNTWAQVSTFPATISHTHIVVTKNKVFAIGGGVGGSTSSAIYNATINTDGTIGSWSNIGSIPSVITNGSMIVTKNRVHLLGGTNGSSALNTVYTAPINADGTLGAWTTGNTLPGTLHYTNAVITKNRVYLFGGHNGSGYVSTVYYAAINSDGTLGTWFTNSVALPNALGEHYTVVTKNRVYLIGGYNGSAYVSTILTAAINPDGSIGTWSTHGSFPVTIGAHISFVTKNTIYVMGGYQAGGYPSNVYYAPINSDGIIGAWSTGSGNVFGGAHTRMFATSTRLYAVGGHNGAATNIVQAALINGITNDYSPYYDGSITAAAATEDVNYMLAGGGKPWVQQYQINMSQASDLTWTAGPSLPVATNAFSVITTKNRVYGFFNGPAANANIYTAIINSDGTIGTWSVAGGIGVTWGSGEALVIKNKVYLIGGGWNGGYSSNAIYVATINADGTLGAFALSPRAMPYSASDIYTFITNNRIYLVGGYNGSYLNYVYSCPINNDGTLGAWVQATNFPSVFTEGSVVVTKNRVYIVGGYNGSHVGTIYTAPIQTNGFIGAWTSAGSLPSNVHGGTMYATNNRVYIIGGSNGVSYQNTVYYAPIDVDGTIGAWTAGTAYPEAVSGLECISTSTRLYAMGGYKLSPTGPIATVYQATITGGLNDVSPYYDGSVSYTDASIVMASTFFLPDLTQDEKFDTTSYIKY